MKNIQAKKSLGQNFLRSSAAVEAIVNASHVSRGDVVVEVGPGEGVLTQALLDAGAQVIAIEKDNRCIPLLTRRFADVLHREQLTLIEGDILDANVTGELYDEMLDGIPTFKVVANIPYYITGMLFRYFLEEHRQPSQLTFLVQKEVAEQIVSQDKKETILSLSIKVYGDPVYVGTIEKGSFDPMPKVDSAILVIKNIGKQRLNGLSEERFFAAIKAGFRAKRKMLANNLSQHFSKEKSDVERLLASLSLSPAVRAEDLNIEDWIRLARAL